MSNFIANARIAVFADTTAFSAALKKVVTQAEKTKIEIKLVPDPVGFIAEARKQLTRIEERLPPVSVRVIPDLTGFPAAVRGAALAAVRDIKIPVGVAPAAAAAPRAAAAVGAAGGASRSAITAEKALNDALAAGVFARRRISGEMSDQERRVLRLEREEAHLAASENAVTKAIREQNVALADQAVRERAAATAAVERTRAQIAAPAVRGAAATSAEEKTAKQTAEQENLKKTNALLEQRRKFESDANSAAVAASLARQKALEKELKGLLAVDKATEDRIIKEQAATAATRSRQSQLERSTRTRGLNVIGDRAIKQNEALETSADAAARSETQFAAARRHTAIAAAKESDLVAKLAATKAAERAATVGLAEAEIALNEARAAALGSTSKELRNTAAIRASQFDLAKGRVQEAEAATKQAQAQLVASGRFSASRRAIEATGAQLAGLRGAALSAQGAFIATAAALIALTKASTQAAQLESTLNTFKVTAGATADQMSRVSATAQQLGADLSLPGVSAADAADALTLLSKAGLSVQDSIDSARGVLQLATAAQIDNAQATELTASALNAFGLAGIEAVHVADVLANAANASQGSIVDIGVALQQAAAVARQAGLSLEQTVGALTLFARAGLKGSDAGTSLRTALIRLINPTAKAQEQIEKLGLHLRTATGAINLNVFDEFAQKTKNLTAAQRDQALAIIFGQDAIRGAAILARSGTAGLDAQIAGLNQSGTAAAVASARMSGMTGAVENLKNQLSALGITIGQAINPALAGMADTLALAVGQINLLISPIPKAVKGLLSLRDAIRDATSVQAFGLKFSPLDLGDVRRQVKIASEIAQKVLNDQPVEFNIDVGRARIAGLIEDLNKIGGPTKLNETVRALQQMREQFAGGDETSKKFASDIDVLIKRLQKASTSTKLDPFKLDIEIPPEILSGQPGRLAGEASKKGFLASFAFKPSDDFGLQSFVDAFAPGGKAAAEKFFGAFAEAATKVIPSITKDINQTTGAQNVLQGQALSIDITGGPRERQRLLKNLQAQQKLAERQVQNQLQLLKPNQRSSEDLRKAQKALKDIQDQQQQIRDDIASDAEKAKRDAEQKAKEIQDARDKADQAFIDALQVGRTPFERRLARAQATTGGVDNISALVAFRKRLLSEVNQVKAGVKDAKTKATELRRLSDELFQNSLDIQEARKARNDALAQALSDKGVAIQSIGETTGSFKLIIRGLDLQITSAREVLAKAKIAKTGIEAARAAVETLKKTRRDTINSARDALLEQAFSLAEARGNKSAMLQIIDLQIAQAKLEQKQAKTLLDQLVAQTKIQELINKRKEILADQVDKAQQGTTVLDLLRQGIETFNASAGNLINANQPFAGPNAFNADIAQFLKFRKRPPTGATGVGPSGLTTSEALRFGVKPGKEVQQQTALTTSLIKALQELTAATLAASGNTSTAAGTAPVVKGPPWSGRPWFGAGGWSRAAQES